jgi:hypothetical protein
MERARPKVLSLGGGLDSWAMLLDAEARGELPDVVAFVDVGDPDDREEQPGEWDGTYRHVEEVVRPWCRARGIEFVEISARTGYLIRPENQAARSLFAWLWQMGQIPVAGPNRICTRIAKVERFEAWLDATYPGREVEVWIGFDAAETARAENDPNAGKPRGPSYGAKPTGPLAALGLAWRWTRALAWAMTHAGRVNRFPLIERGLCRCRCEALARASGYPVPRKSACQFCLSGDTEVVTRDGVLPLRALVGHAELLVPITGKFGGLMHRGKFRNVEVRSFGQQPLYEVKLRRMKSKRSVRATAEHRWFVTAGSQWDEPSKHERTTKQLRTGDRLRTLRASPPVKERIMSVAVAQGFVFGDGSHDAHERPASVTLHGKKDEALLPYFAGMEARMQMVRSEFAGKRIADKPALHIYGLPRFWKRTPPLRESRAFLLSWLAGYFAADGSVSKTGQAVLESASYDAIKFARDAAAVCGVGYTKIGERWRVGKGKRSTPIYRLCLRLADLPDWFFLIEHHRERVAAQDRSKHDPPWIVESIRKLGCTEEVFCAVVPGAQAFGLSEDLMTGNCPYASRGDWQRFAVDRPARFAKVVELEARKPPTVKNGIKLSIMDFNSKTKIGRPLPVFVSRPYAAKVVPCAVCGAPQRATKAAGCGYLSDGAEAAA